MSSQFAPVFETNDGDRVILPFGPDWVADDAGEAVKIGWGGSFIEGIMLGLHYHGETAEIVDGNLPHYQGQIGQFGTKVCIIGGPMFDKQDKEAANA